MFDRLICMKNNFTFRSERDLNRTLRQEQDQEYIRSLEKDKWKTEQRKREQDAEKQAEKLRKEREDEKQRKIEVPSRLNSAVLMKFSTFGLH